MERVHQSVANAPAIQTVADALRWGRQALLSSPTASLDAQLLLGHVLQRPRSWVIAHENDELAPWQIAVYGSLVQRRRAGEPVAYLRGYVEWLDLELEVTPEVLIPRPETELVVERALETAGRRRPALVADIGTGSGAIAIALARRLHDADVLAVDVSDSALRVAARNLARYDLSPRVRLLQGSLLQPLEEPPDLIVANLPYLSDHMMRTLEPGVRFEPPIALHGGNTGFELYEELFRQLRSRAWQPVVVLEIDPRQSRDVRRLAPDLLPGMTWSIYPDYAGHDRVVLLDPAHKPD